jgi:SAM-dependent methyltransferase
MDSFEIIGKIKLDYERYSGTDLYSDGDIEDELLRIVQEYPEGEYTDAIESSGSWPILYHLSPLRGNIVQWLPIPGDAKVLEVGSGCGAITGTLAEKAKSVDCVDLSRRRSLVNAYRNRSRDNVTIHVGNFRDIEPDLPCDYDYICLIGVFEYGRAYIGGETPYEDFLNILKKHLAPQGRLVIAIENKFGLKYWAGCREDHNGEYFSGLEDYPGGGTARTFTRRGLEKLLQGSGLTDYSFYYPYPDYKFMHTVYSDRNLPRQGELSTNLRNFDRERMLLFDETAVFNTILREEEFPLFSNSYMVVTGAEPDVLYSKFSNERVADKQIRTDVIIKKDAASGAEKRWIRKAAVTTEAKAHLERIKKASDLLEKRYEGSGLKINACREAADGSLLFPFIEGAESLEALLDRALAEENLDEFRGLIIKYREMLEYRAGEPVADYDAIFANVLVTADGTWHLIDYEWSYFEALDIKEIAFRAWYCYRMGSEKRASREEWYLKLFGITPAEADAFRQREAEFQKEVTGQRLALGDLRDRIGNPVISPVAGQKVRAGGEELRYRVQLYPDCGAGFAEDTSIFLSDCYRGEEALEVEYELPEKIRTLRVDPCMFPCLVTVEKVQVGDRELPLKKIRANGKSISRGGYIFATEDPGLTLPLPFGSGGKVLKMQMRVVRLGKETAEEVTK